MHLVPRGVTRRGRSGVPEPPWVWGPAEVNEWIRAAYPSKRRHAHAARKGAEIVTRLRIVVEGADAQRLRVLMTDAVESIGLTMTGPPGGRDGHRVVGVFRRSLGHARVHVSLRFNPPIHVSSVKRIVERVGGQVHIVGVSTRRGRAPLPPRSA